MDLVLGMDWLARWNPGIDCQRQVIHIYVNRYWTQVYGVLLDEPQKTGTLKILDAYLVVKENKMPEWLVTKKSTLWSIEKKYV